MNNQSANKSGLEIERKFLINWKAMTAELARPLDQCPVVEITQGYLSFDPESEIRLRKTVGRSGTLFFQTVKRGSGLVRMESEIQIDRIFFETFWKYSQGRRLYKLRYQLDITAAQTALLDVYQHPLQGLVLLEVEFQNQAQAEDFNPPAWITREVTDDVNYTAKMLAANGLP